MGRGGKKESEDSFIYGRRPVAEALRANSRRIQKVLLNAEAHGSSFQEIVALLKEKRIHHQWVPARELFRLAPGPNQGVVALVSPKDYLLLEDWLASLSQKENPWVLLLDGIEDPHNLGAIIRSAVCFGCDGVVIPEWRAAPVTPAVVKSSAGATEHVAIVRAKNLSHPLLKLKEMGFRIAGAHLEGQDLRQTDWQGPTALVVGGEGQGLRPIMQKHCDVLVRIPQQNTIASLNASCAAAIIFYELFRSLPKI